MKITIGQSLLIPEGTLITFFSGSVLDKNPFHTHPIQYNALGKVSSINKQNISIDVWHHGSEGGSIINIPVAEKHKLKPTDYILDYDCELGRTIVLNPERLPPQGAREYDIEVSYETESKGETVETSVWALSRKEALKIAKIMGEVEFGAQKFTCAARLRYKNQKPFDKAVYLNQK